MLKISPKQLRQSGISLVELLVGIAVGLIVVAGATLLTTSQLTDNRQLLTETQLQQDLRATTDIIARELRRAGFWNVSEEAVWTYAKKSAANTYLNVTQSTSAQISYNYKKLNGSEGVYGFKLNGGVIEYTLGGGSSTPQALTDKNVLVISSFSIEPQPEKVDPSAGDFVEEKLPCPRLCPPTIPPTAADACWPTISIRSFKVTVAGHPPDKEGMVRTITSQVRLRNDAVRFNYNDGSSLKACPE